MASGKDLKKQASSLFLRVTEDDWLPQPEQVVETDHCTALINAPESNNCTSVTETISTDRSMHVLIHSIQPTLQCSSSWDSMKGSDCLRQCVQCRLWVIKPNDLSEPGLLRLLNETLPLANQETGAQKASADNTLSPTKQLRLFRRTDGTLTIGDCYARRCPSPEAVASFFALPLFLHVMTWLMAPGYIIPFLNFLPFRLFFMAAIVWHILGCTLYSRILNRCFGIIVVLFFMLPLIVLPMLLGPDHTEIMQAFGPIAHP